jgi:hypothetical protein
MARYLLSIIQPDGAPPAPEVFGPIMARVAKFSDELASSGAWVFNAGLHDAGSTTVVRVKDGEMVLTDGPYVEAKEHVGGLVIVDVPDLDAALVWARKAAEATTLPIEVRPFRDEFPT